MPNPALSKREWGMLVVPAMLSYAGISCRTVLGQEVRPPAPLISLAEQWKTGGSAEDDTTNGYPERLPVVDPVLELPEAKVIGKKRPDRASLRAMSQERQQGKGGSADQKKPAPAKPGAPAAAPRTSTGSIPAQGMDSKVVKPSEYSTDASMLTKTQKNQLGSQFADNSAERRRNSLLQASMPAMKAADDDDEPTSIGMKFDGKQVPPALQGRDVWIAVQAPLQSREGKRNRELSENVLKQFGVTVNPRYAEDAPAKGRGHIFVWDVSRAMNCEIPHFVGAKELTLAQTCDWVRHEGPMRGWKRLSGEDIFTAANAGKLVIALPREMRTKHIAVVSPQAMTEDGSPRLTGICLKRDVAVHPRDMFGSKPIDCFFHE